jgi:hypothetical protein
MSVVTGLRVSVMCVVTGLRVSVMCVVTGLRVLNRGALVILRQGQEVLLFSKPCKYDMEHTEHNI